MNSHHNIELKLNTLNVLHAREVFIPPSHFTYITINDLHQNSLKQWIYTNLNSRFYLGTSLQLVDNKYVIQTKIGFEDHKELSFFLLVCPFLK